MDAAKLANLKKQWAARRYEDAFFAQADSLLTPDMVDLKITGDFIAAVFKPGIRTFMVHGQTNRDRFVNNYRGRGFSAKPCKDPSL